MSDDLVKRLRDVQDNWPLRDIELEAADRIEALEAALQTLTTKAYADFDGGRKLRRYDIDKARTALGEKKDE